MDREGLEPSVFLMWRIYSPLPSPLGIPTHIQDTKYTFYQNVLELIAVCVPLLYKSIIFYAYADRDRRSQPFPHKDG